MKFILLHTSLINLHTHWSHGNFISDAHSINVVDEENDSRNTEIIVNDL